MLKRLLEKILPDFLKDSTKLQTDETLFNYRKIWFGSIIGMLSVSLIPLLFLAAWNVFQFKKAIEAEKKLPVLNEVSHASQTISMYLDERESALRFILEDKSFNELSDSKRLAQILLNLKIAIGDVVDIGLITSDGILRTYVGPYKLIGKNYEHERWFDEVIVRGLYISEVFLGFRNFPHIVIAAKHEKSDGDFYILRITLDIQKFYSLIGNTHSDSSRDIFLINKNGVIQTPSKFYGEVLKRVSIVFPKILKSSDISVFKDSHGNKIFLGYSKIEGSPFKLLVVDQTDSFFKLQDPFHSEMIGFLIVSIVILIIVIFRISTTMVSRIEEADRKRVKFLHKIEHTNKMASIGRLAAGVAHEINNPLAIINQKAGLLNDLCNLDKDMEKRDSFLKISDSILKTVERCSKITHRMLGFAKHIDVQLESLNLKVLLEEVIGFLAKEAEYRNIEIGVISDPEIPEIYSDRSQLQQVFINIINNALAATPNGGEIIIKTNLEKSKTEVSVSVTDNGHGIAPEHLKNIFEPFFTTKGREGTGLGLSVTYGIVKKLKGKISVDSIVNKGTTFKFIFPIKRYE